MLLILAHFFPEKIVKSYNQKDLWKLKRQNELLSETRVIEELEKIRVVLVKRDEEKPKFVFENMDLDQMRLFTELRLDTILKDTRVTV